LQVFLFSKKIAKNMKKKKANKKKRVKRWTKKKEPSRQKEIHSRFGSLTRRERCEAHKIGKQQYRLEDN